MSPILTACAIIYRFTPDQKVECLMTKRALTSSFLPGIYELPGGHIEESETEIAGLIREIKEELNIDIEVGELFDSFTYSHQGQTVIENIYLATLKSDPTTIHLQADEIDSYRFVSETDLDTVIAANKNPNDPELLILRKFFKQKKKLI